MSHIPDRRSRRPGLVHSVSDCRPAVGLQSAVGLVDDGPVPQPHHDFVQIAKLKTSNCGGWAPALGPVPQPHDLWKLRSSSLPLAVGGPPSCGRWAPHSVRFQNRTTFGNCEAQTPHLRWVSPALGSVRFHKRTTCGKGSCEVAEAQTPLSRWVGPTLGPCPKGRTRGTGTAGRVHRCPRGPVGPRIVQVGRSNGWADVISCLPGL